MLGPARGELGSGLAEAVAVVPLVDGVEALASLDSYEMFQNVYYSHLLLVLIV